MVTVEDEYLKYFPGGREGVQGRFGKEFQRRLSKFNTDELLGIAGEELEYDILLDILNGDYSRINGKVIEKLSNIFMYSVNEGLGMSSIPLEDKPKIFERIKRDQFISICWTKLEDGKLSHANGNEIPGESLLEIYVTLEALRQL